MSNGKLHNYVLKFSLQPTIYLVYYVILRVGIFKITLNYLVSLLELVKKLVIMNMIFVPILK